ncbi:MAG: diaminopimelate epimerase [Pseudanabaenaceae cyanobacterium bins.68]|nr:diaminopimelate epimerase [Pseudanabaenaceae cyanobacterium bins.68]
MALPFTKYQGLGNDFILIDHRDRTDLQVSPDQAIAWCDRHFGIGADGVILLLSAPDQGYQMRILNADGSEPEMCGNGIRCLAKFMQDLGIPPQSGRSAPYYQIHTLAGLITTALEPDHLIGVDMGAPRLAAQEIPASLGVAAAPVINFPLTVAGHTWQVTTVSMGNPHCVVFVPDLAQIDLTTLGPQFEHHPAFPQRINTEFVQVLSPNHLKMQVWERGAGITMACGTGACAVVVAAVLNELSDRTCRVSLPGGDLQICWQEQDDHVRMTGPAIKVFEGTI